MAKEIKVNRRISHDSMSISVKLHTGASLKFSINRLGEKLELAFSNDAEILRNQMSSMKNWLELRKGENNLQRFDRLENLMRNSTSGSHAIAQLDKF
jgi:hypothetical protein